MSIETMKLALEALENVPWGNLQVQAMTALHQAIAEATKTKWKLMPEKATDEMLKAMDECSTEGYDDRLYAGHASSVYSAAWDAFQAHDTTPPQRKPLSDFEIKTVIASIDPAEQYLPNALKQFARAIEAAHGIKGDA